MSRAVVSEDGRVTIPKPARERLGLRPGQVLEFEAERGRLVARKVPAEDPLMAVYGVLDLGRTTRDAIAALRGPADTV
jgi:antitoxin PrlF